MENHESDPQNHETALRRDGGCIFLFSREQLLPPGSFCPMSEAPASVRGSWGRVSSPTSSPPAVLRLLARPPSLLAGISTQGINCCLKGKRNRIRRIKVQRSLRALSSRREASLPVRRPSVWPTFATERGKVVQASAQKISSRITYEDGYHSVEGEKKEPV